MSIEHPHTTGLGSGAHHWHLVGSSLSAVYIDCCGPARARNRRGERIVIDDHVSAR